MNRKILALGLAALGLAAPAFSQSNFSVQPAPIPYPFFQEGRQDNKFVGTYIGMKDDGKTSGSSLSLNGGGLTGLFRKALNDSAAVDFGLGGFFMSGSITNSAFGTGSSMDMKMMDLSYQLNLELQPYHDQNFALILFAGPNLATDFSFIKIPAITVGSGPFSFTQPAQTQSTTILLGGVQGGVQLGINAGPFRIAPFFMIIGQGGSATTGGTSTTIPFFTIPSYGADIVYKPWGLSVGTILQSVAANGTNSGYKTTFVQLGWHWGAYD